MAKITIRLSTLILSLGVSTSPVTAQVNLVASIKPLHSIAASVSKGIFTPTLLIEGFESPHSFQLRPSKAKLVQQADLILWVGQDLETFLARPLKIFGARQLELLQLDELTKLEQRDFLDLRKRSSKRQKSRNQLRYDPHIWLSPTNASQIAKAIAKKLSELDPKNSTKYRANATQFETEMRTIKSEIFELLTPVQTYSFLVFHDAFQYFETAFNLSASQAITASMEQRPGAKRVRELNAFIKKQNISCIFVEPQGSKKLAVLAAEGTNAKIAELDILGVHFEAGENLYRQTMVRMATVMKECLSPN